MYALLLCLGAAITIAGIVLVGEGVPIGGRPYDPIVITPGAVAIVGGLILLGLGVTVRVLRRIERALAAQQASRTAAGAVQGTVAENPVAPSVLLPPPLPDQPVVEPQPPPATAALSAPIEDVAAQQRLHEKFPALVRLDGAVMAEDGELSLLPKAPSRSDALPDATSAVASAPARSTTTPPSRGAVPRRDSATRAVGRSDRRSLDEVWPKRPVPVRTSPPSPIPPSELSAPAESGVPFEPVPSLPAHVEEPAAPLSNGAGVATPVPVPVSILKSGIVDGMAYTVYSDGSIEAQLPEGTLRFKSIAELRQHVEQHT